jgi:hypothetical protein
MRNLIATYESHLAIKVLMFICFSKWAAGIGFVYNTALAYKASEFGVAAMVFPSLGIAYNLFLLMRNYLKNRQTRAFCLA